MQLEVNQMKVNGSKEDELVSTYAKTARQYFSETLANGSYISAVAELDGKLVSANGLILYGKPPSITGGTGRLGFISNVYTRPAWRGKGIASTLMKMIVTYARSNDVEKLHLGATDLGKSIYERVGFITPRFTPLELRL